jgi:hypothetical protein
VSIFLFGFARPSPKSKNVCQSMKRRAARRPPRRSSGSVGSVAFGSKISAKNCWVASVALVPKFAR